MILVVVDAVVEVLTGVGHIVEVGVHHLVIAEVAKQDIMIGHILVTGEVGAIVAVGAGVDLAVTVAGVIEGIEGIETGIGTVKEEGTEAEGHDDHHVTAEVEVQV